MSIDELSRRRALSAATAIGLGVPLLAACSDDAGSVTDRASEGSSSPAAAQEPLGATTEIPEGGGVVFAEAKVVVTQPTAGDFKAFSAVCTHQKCLVSDVTDTINCACHSSMFSIDDGSVIDGPAPDPLQEAEISIDGDTISLG